MLIYLDTNVLSYVVQETPEFLARTTAALARLGEEGHTFAISYLVRMECQVGPLLAGDDDLLRDFDAFIVDVVSEVLDLPAEVFARAAVIRASYRLDPLDALHLAAAVEGGCGGFLTNDPRLARFPDLEMILLPASET